MTRGLSTLRTAMATRLPQRLFAVVRGPGEDEEEVREAVEVAHALAADVVAAGDRPALGAAADGPADVQLRGRGRAARQHEGLEWRKAGVHVVARALQPGGLLGHQPQA